MNVHYVVSILLGGPSGKEKATTDKAKHLAEQAGNFNVFSLKRRRKSTLLRAWDMLWVDIKYFMMLVLGIVQKPDVIFTRTTFSLGTHLVGAFYGIPVIREVHADPVEETEMLFSDRPFVRWLSRIHAQWSRFLLRRSNGLIFNHPKLQQHYKDAYGFDVPAISAYNGADTVSFYPMPRDQVMRRLNLKPNKKYLLFLGSVSPWHGVEYVAEMFVRLRDRRSDVELLVVGGGGGMHAAAMRQRYASVEGIHFIGAVSNEQAVHYINAATACLLPVKNIRVSPGSPIKLFDYISCGKPVISQADTIGYSDLVEKYGLGMTCDLTDSVGSAKAVDNFLEVMDSDYYRDHNRHVAENDLNWSNTIEKWLSFANEIRLQQQQPKT